MELDDLIRLILVRHFGANSTALNIDSAVEEILEAINDDDEWEIDDETNFSSRY